MLRKIAAIAAVATTPAFAQVATDGSAGARVTLTGPRFNISETLGTRVGRNLLHSFSLFNIRAGEQAAFTGFTVTDNIIARITAGSPSTIDGQVRVEMAGANLFLVNPAGLVFGPNASIDVPAAFYASTGQTMRLSDGTVVDMRTASPVSLTAAPPSAFGFESTGAAIALNGAQLRARDGNRIALVGGDVTLSRSSSGRVAVLSAPSGAVDVVATRGAGNVAIGDRLDPSGFAAMGDVTLRDGSTLSASEGTGRLGGGTVYVRGGNVTLDHAQVESRTRFANSRGIDIGATGRLAIDASNVVAVTTGAGNAGYLRLSGQDVAISGGSLVDTSCDPGCTTGRGGDLSITAGNGLTITGNDPNLPTFVVSNSFGGGATGPIFITTGGALTMSGTSFIQGIALDKGDGSSITLRTGSIDLSGGAQVDASTRGTGRGGTITVENRGDIRLSGTREDPTQVDPATGGKLTLPSGFFASAGGSGDAGSIVISTANLSVLSGAEIGSTAQDRSLGQGGSIAVRATGLVRVDGRNEAGKSSAIVANTFSVGNAGAIDISADRIEVSNDGRIQSQTEGRSGVPARGDAGSIKLRARQMTLSSGGQVATSSIGGGASGLGGNGGSIDVGVTDSLTITGVSASGGGVSIGDGGTNSREVPSGIFANTSTTGKAGDITVRAGTVQVLGGGEISSTVLEGADGDGGRIDLGVAGLLRVAGASASGRRASVAANTLGSGNAGEINLQADRIEIAGGGGIEALTARRGDANTIRIRGRDLEISSGGILSTETGGTGKAGLVDIVLTGTLSIIGDDGVFRFSSPGFPDVVVPRTGIFSQTKAEGSGGRIVASARDILVDRGTVLGGTIVPSGSVGSSPGAAGSVELSASGSLNLRQGSIVSTFSQNRGANAGDIAIRVGDTLRLESGARVTTQALRADGGNVTVQVGNVAILDGASITTEVGTGLGAGGNIDFATPTLSMNRSSISANAFGGPGGNIGVGAETLFVSADSKVTASSVLNVDGTITFESPALDPTGELLAPAPVFLDAGAVLAGRCGPRLAGRASSLVVLPRAVEGRYPDELRPILDGRPVGFLTRPAPQACAPEAPATVAQVTR